MSSFTQGNCTFRVSCSLCNFPVGLVLQRAPFLVRNMCNMRLRFWSETRVQSGSVFGAKNTRPTGKMTCSLLMSCHNPFHLHDCIHIWAKHSLCTCQLCIVVGMPTLCGLVSQARVSLGLRHVSIFFTCHPTESASIHVFSHVV